MIKNTVRVKYIVKTRTQINVYYTVYNYFYNINNKFIYDRLTTYLVYGYNCE